MDLQDKVRETREIVVEKAGSAANKTAEIVRLDGKEINVHFEGIDIYETLLSLAAGVGLTIFVIARSFTRPILDMFFYVAVWGYFLPLFLLAAYEERRGKGSIVELVGVVLGAFVFISVQSAENPWLMFHALGIFIVINMLYNLGGEAEAWVPRIWWLIKSPFKVTWFLLRKFFALIKWIGGLPKRGIQAIIGGINKARDNAKSADDPTRQNMEFAPVAPNED